MMKCTLGIVSQPLDAFTIFFTPDKSKIRNMNDTVIQITLWLSILLKRGALSISFYRLMNVTSDMNWGDFVDCEMNVLFLVFAWIRFCHRRLNLLASGERLRMFFFFFICCMAETLQFFDWLLFIQATTCGSFTANANLEAYRQSCWFEWNTWLSIICVVFIIIIVCIWNRFY